MAKQRVMTLRISAELDAALIRMAKREEVSKSHLIRSILRKILSKNDTKGCR